MILENELAFFADTLKRHRIRCDRISSRELTVHLAKRMTESIPGDANSEDTGVPTLARPIARTVYRFTDRFGFSYIYFPLTLDTGGDLFLIGPYLQERPSANRLLEYADKNALSAKQRRYLQDYYSSVQLVERGGLFYNMLYSLCERLWGTSDLAITDVNDETGSPVSPIGAAPKEENFNEILADMKAMEKRYGHENELIEAVALGQAHKAGFFTSSFSDAMFEKRLPNLLRNAQNYCIIMNTLLRKAVEKGGVHPVYIDRVSSDFALKIEALPSTSETANLMREMFTTYSTLVRKHTMMGYSETVKNTVLLIDSDISAPITPSAIAKTLGVSLGYLSTVFKKETGKTLTEYLTKKRISHAKHLLATTQLQIQAVALRCGILDMQYFSKLFKKHTGSTPKEYRESSAKIPRSV